MDIQLERFADLLAGLIVKYVGEINFDDLDEKTQDEE